MAGDSVFKVREAAYRQLLALGENISKPEPKEEDAVKNTKKILVRIKKSLPKDHSYEEFKEKLLEKVAEIKVGNGLEDGTWMGPCASESQLNTVLHYIEKGKEEGAELLYGGKKYVGEGCNTGFYVEPTVFDSVDNSMTIAQEEIFGPVLALIKVDSTEEAIQVANDVQFGLSASIFTTNIQKMLDFIKHMDAGLVRINAESAGVELQAPFGGMKQSGLGREGPRGVALGVAARIALEGERRRAVHVVAGHVVPSGRVPVPSEVGGAPEHAARHPGEPGRVQLPRERRELPASDDRIAATEDPELLDDAVLGDARRRGDHRFGCRGLAGARRRPRRAGTGVLSGVAILLYGRCLADRGRLAPAGAGAPTELRRGSKVPRVTSRSGAPRGRPPMRPALRNRASLRARRASGAARVVAAAGDGCRRSPRPRSRACGRCAGSGCGASRTPRRRRSRGGPSRFPSPARSPPAARRLLAGCGTR